MAGYNRIILAGNVTRDPEIRYVQSGKAVVKFTIAVNRKSRGGEEVLFVDLVAWEKLAENCNNLLKKGAGVLVEGRLVMRKYDDKNGEKRTATEVVIDSMQLLDKREGSGSSGKTGYDSGFGDEPDEIPF